MEINGILDRLIEQNNPESQPTKTGSEYVRTFRRGAIAASVFRRQNSAGTPYMDIALSRAWKDAKSGKEGYSGSFYARNADDLKAVTQLLKEEVAETARLGQELAERPPLDAAPTEPPSSPAAGRPAAPAGPPDRSCARPDGVVCRSSADRAAGHAASG